MAFKQFLKIGALVIFGLSISLVACAPDQDRSYIRAARDGKSGPQLKGGKFPVKRMKVDQNGNPSKTGKNGCVNLETTLAGFTNVTSSKAPSVEAMLYTRSVDFRIPKASVEFQNLERLKDSKVTGEYLASNTIAPQLIYLLDYFTVGKWPLGTVQQKDCKTLISKNSSSSGGAQVTVSETTYDIESAQGNSMTLRSDNKIFFISFEENKLTISELSTVSVDSSCEIESLKQTPALIQEVSTVLQWGPKKNTPAQVDAQLSKDIITLKKRVSDSFKSAVEGMDKGANYIAVDLDAYNISVSSPNNEEPKRNCF